MSYNTVSVGTSATKIVSVNSQRQSVIITNTDTAKKLYLGPDSGVTTANGIEIPASGSFTEDSGGSRLFQGDIYGVTTATTIDVRFWERTNAQ